ncbi:MAG: amidophosphoribosyltransferase, partial [Saprospiraceae bacterium]|nr:amidophosphoribosyltransferase [Saprospiraceae bacterium]
IRYPDCYGIDMSIMGHFVAFQAMVSLLKENNKKEMLADVYQKCQCQQKLPKEEVTNQVSQLYEQFGYEEISNKISEIVTPKEIDAEVKIIYQTLEGLHHAVPNHSGDWFFSGSYPTPGGMKVVNRSFINYMENSNSRAY